MKNLNYKEFFLAYKSVNMHSRQPNIENKKRNIKIKVYDYPDREFMVYNGAAQFVNVVKDDRLYWVSKEEYAECGGSIGARKEKLSKFYTEYA